MSVVDVILNSKIPIHTIVEGCAASAGTIISVVGEKRFITKHSRMLIHQLSSGVWGKMEEINDHHCNSIKLMETIKSIYAEHAKFSPKKLKKILKKDIWLNAEECLKYGLVDKII